MNDHTQEFAPELYLELAKKVTDEMPEILWFDLWRNQVGFLENELPFPTPAMFVSFRTAGDIKDLGQNVQQVPLQIDFYLFYETFAGTYQGSVNQDDAVAFLKSVSNLNKTLHGTSGEHYTGMSRRGFAPEDTGNAGNLWRITYQCASMDYSAQKAVGEGTFKDVTVEKNDFVIEP